MNESKVDEYLYVINYQYLEKDICLMEMKHLFGTSGFFDPNVKWFFSGDDIDPSRSPYIKHRIVVVYSAPVLEGLMDQLESNRVAYENFKFVHFRIEEGEIGYEEWIRCVTLLGTVIDGEVDMENPLTLLGAVKLEGRWIFGLYEKNDNRWKEHDNKPNTNSHSLGLRTARALVNIAVENTKGCSLVDPCCGVGTVLLEALSMNIKVKGFEINRIIAEKAIINLEFFGFHNIITTGDMHEIKEHFDISIVDIPYGLFTPVTAEQQVDIIKTARRISDRMVIITFEDMAKEIEISGFEIIDRCCVCKGKFKRFISVCR